MLRFQNPCDDPAATINYRGILDLYRKLFHTVVVLEPEHDKKKRKISYHVKTFILNIPFILGISFWVKNTLGSIFFLLLIFSKDKFCFGLCNNGLLFHFIVSTLTMI